MRSPWLYTSVWLFAAGAVQAEVVLYDFERDAEVDAWRSNLFGSPRAQPLAPHKLARSPDFATSGKSSMAFTTAKRKGAALPSIEARPPIPDWRSSDRLVIDVANPSDEPRHMGCAISDGKLLALGQHAPTLVVPGRGFKRFVIPLSTFHPATDRSSIAAIILLAFPSKKEATVYVDNVLLLAPEEAVPKVPAAFVARLAERFGEDGSLDELIIEYPDHDRELAQARDPSLRAAAVERFQRAFDAAEFSRSPMMVGFATSMEKILPRDMSFQLTVAKDVEVSLARNENESFQVAVMPREQALKKVSVSVGDLKSDSGGVFASENIDCDVVGYVQTKRRPPYRVSYVGWWPDPILDFLGPVDVASGDLQTFWIRVHAPKEHAPGVYHGTIRVSAEGVEPLSFGLTARICSFTVPDHSPLPTATSFQGDYRKAQMGGEENWHEMKFKYADFLADYYIDYDWLYRQGSPDYEVVKRLHDQGCLVAFNLGNVFNAGTKAEGFEQAIADTVKRIRPAYEKAKMLGLLDHAYIYGFDERSAEQFVLLERSAQSLKKAFPEVLLMTTSSDRSYGLESVVKTIDAWCPLTPGFDPQRAARARAQGKKVWWYICVSPQSPYANWFVEYAAIETRLLMGAMTAKYRPDGFLYYSLCKWNENKPIQEGPFTSWNPVSWTVFHGDGSLLCSGPGGKPVPTIRLENFRDGLEDFAYASILEETIRRYEAKRETLSREDEDWLEEAKAALLVPESLVKTMSEYSHDPKSLYAYRNRLAELIDRSSMPDVTPWETDFCVRGFPTRPDGTPMRNSAASD